ncbi:hypothetical protein LCGC14_1989450 [marine sediment metagenome]|uniref:DUF669 domain-containing protein n=1 Tax=marine sediment metagenome TaxID=412755 RepID=A0A0F9FUK6_9ZZZZ
MSFIELPGLADTSEPKIVPEGEYDLCIIQAKLNEKDGSVTIMTILDIEGQENAANVFHYIALPGPDDEEDKRKAKLLFAKRFFYQFGIEMDGGIELEQFVGSRALGNLKQDEYEGQLKNVLQVNRLPAEAEDE